MRFSGNLLYHSAVADGVWGILPDKALFFPVRWGTRTYSHQIRTYLNLSFRKKWMFRHTPERLPAKKKKQTEFHRLLCCTRYIHQRTVSILSVLSTQIYSEIVLCPLPSIGRTAVLFLCFGFHVLPVSCSAKLSSLPEDHSGTYQHQCNREQL